MSSEVKTSIIEKFNPQFEYGEVILLLIVACQYFKLWISPEIDQAETIFQLAMLMAFEFVMVHSGVFMALMPKKISLFVFVPFYALFALAFNSMTDNNFILGVYLITVFNRMRFAFTDVDEKIRHRVIKKSILAVTIYFFLTMAVSMGNTIIPDFGLSEQNLSSMGYNEAKTHGGLFLDVPKTAICLGSFYYLFMAFITYSINKN